MLQALGGDEGVHGLGDLVPGHGVACAVGAEYRPGGVLCVRAGVVARPLDHFLGVVAGLGRRMNRRDTTAPLLMDLSLIHI